jgi:hypothetical protein
MWHLILRLTRILAPQAPALTPEKGAATNIAAAGLAASACGGIRDGGPMKQQAAQNFILGTLAIHGEAHLLGKNQNRERRR